MSTKEEREKAYQEAIIKLSRNLPQLMEILKRHTEAMENLARAINLMPRSVRMHP